MSGFDYLKSWPLYLLPQHGISRLIYRLTRIESPLVPKAITLFSRVFGVNLEEAGQPDPAAYPTFNAFFTRSLKPGVRVLKVQPRQLVSPVDGTISQLGPIRSGRIIQAKGHDYSVLELLGGDEARAAPFANGQFITLYLSPRDYHRIHMPLTGSLREQVYVPGRLFSVAPHTVRTIPRLFARNERVVAIFDTEFGKLAMVLVGAINVAAIETIWDGLITPPHQDSIGIKQYAGLTLEQGDEMGRFNMGSTVILLLEQETIRWAADRVPGYSIQLFNPLGQLKPDEI
ncbi:MAG TPA: archaetidylserine decarboxylase [Thiolinea sp.]|nr:archaetidylserine decarboxylase [Thiolinea sp.]